MLPFPTVSLSIPRLFNMSQPQPQPQVQPQPAASNGQFHGPGNEKQQELHGQLHDQQEEQQQQQQQQRPDYDPESDSGYPPDEWWDWYKAKHKRDRLKKAKKAASQVGK